MKLLYLLEESVSGFFQRMSIVIPESKLFIKNSRIIFETSIYLTKLHYFIPDFLISEGKFSYKSPGRIYPLYFFVGNLITCWIKKIDLQTRLINLLAMVIELSIKKLNVIVSTIVTQ